MDTDKALDVAGKVVDFASDFGKFLDKVFGPMATEAGGMLGQQVRFWREMQLLKLNAKFDAELKRRGLSYADLTPLPLGQSVPLIEAASMEESDEVQEMWAGLLASSMDPTSDASFKKVFVALLKEIGPAEAALLDFLWKCRPYQSQINIANRVEIEKALNDLAEERWRRFPNKDQQSAIANLRRLGCALPVIPPPSLRGLLSKKQLGAGSSSWSGRGDTITTLDAEKFGSLMNWMLELVNQNSGAKAVAMPKAVPIMTAGGIKVGELRVPELGLALSPLGIDLMSACRGEFIDH